MRYYLLGIFTLIGTFFIFSGCTSSVDASLVNHKKGEAKIYFYRDGSTASLPATVFVNRRLTGVLAPNQYIETDVCYGKVLVSIKTKTRNGFIANNIALNVSEENNSTLYVRLYETSAGIKAQNVSGNTELLENKEYSEHTINRYIPNCAKNR